MDGRAVRDFITAIFPRLVAEATGDAGVKPADLALVVPHQPNPRLVASLAPDAGLEPRQLAIVGHDVGNIGAASIPSPSTGPSARPGSGPATWCCSPASAPA